METSQPRRIIAAAVAVLASAGVIVPSHASNDHLVSRAEASSTREAYRPFLRHKLSLTGFDYGKITVIPDLGPESSVSVYSKNGKYFATELVAEGRGFWQNWERRNHLKVSRIDAEIPARTAQTLKDMISALLSDIRPSPRVARKDPVWTIRLFEVDRETRGEVLSGDVPREPLGPKSKSVESIYQLLINYCERPLQRRALAAEIEREVAHVFGPIFRNAKHP